MQTTPHTFQIPRLPKGHDPVPDDYNWYDWTPEDAAERGAELLDEVAPGWTQHIHLGYFNMSRGRIEQEFGERVIGQGCVLCQLDFAQEQATPHDPNAKIEGSYIAGAKRMFGSAETAAAVYYGFMLLNDDDAVCGHQPGYVYKNDYDFVGSYHHEDYTWDMLNDAWREEIEARQRTPVEA